MGCQDFSPNTWLAGGCPGSQDRVRPGHHHQGPPGTAGRGCGLHQTGQRHPEGQGRHHRYNQSHHAGQQQQVSQAGHLQHHYWW